jgi:hypothetical protein
MQKGYNFYHQRPVEGRQYWPQVDFIDWCDPYSRDAGEKLPNLF